jgi:diguanylate cyclase (GGDEF)-like protein
MPTLKQRFTGPNSAVVMLFLAAGAVALFTAAAGFLVYDNTQNLIASSGHIQHSDEVISTLARASLLVERVQYQIRLYSLTGDNDDLYRARSSCNSLNTVIDHIRYLVADNPDQIATVGILARQGQQLNQFLDNFTRQSVVPDKEIEHAQQTIGFMNDRETWLLKQRGQGSQHDSVTSLASEITFSALAVVLVVALFGFLVRDALRRREGEKNTLRTNQDLANSVDALKGRAQEITLLTEARDELQLCTDIQQVYSSAAASFARLLAGTSGCLCVTNNSRQLVEMVSSWGEPALQDLSQPESCCGLRSGQRRCRLPGQSEIHCTHFAGQPPERYLCQPIVAHGNTLGVLYVQCPDDATVETVMQRMDGIRQLVQITGMTIATLNLRTRLEHQSIRDPLTNLFNRNFMQISLERELSRAARQNQTLAVLMLDVDHFKRFNDAHGHAAGDAALRRMAEIFQTTIRAEDIACRYGGEEFTIMLPDVTVQTACDRAEQIRASIANLQVAADLRTYSGFTISIGVAFYPADGDSADQLLRRADEALYNSKRLGRNRLSTTAAVPAAD